jgi:putative ABC transport system permease protein
MIAPQDVRFAVRLLAKQPGFTFAASLALALGIGMNATAFTLIKAFLFASLPYQDSDRLLLLARAPGHSNRPDQRAAPRLRYRRAVSVPKPCSESFLHCLRG